MTPPTDAARAVADVARALEPLGPGYLRLNLILHSSGDPARDREALAIDLRYLAGGTWQRFGADQARAVPDAARAALDALPERLDPDFFTTVRNLIKDANGDAR